MNDFALGFVPQHGNTPPLNIGAMPTPEALGQIPDLRAHWELRLADASTEDCPVITNVPSATRPPLPDTSFNSVEDVIGFASHVVDHLTHVCRPATSPLTA